MLGLAGALVGISEGLAIAASDVWGNVGPASPLGADGLRGRYPLSHYGLDQHFEAVKASLTSGVDASGVAPMIAHVFASVVWELTRFLGNAVIELFAFAFSLDLLRGSEATGGAGALAPVARATHSIYADVFGQPWLVVAVTVSGIWAMWRALVQRRYAETAGALGLSLIYVVAAFFFVAQPAKTIGAASAWTNQMSQSFLAIAGHGGPAGGAGARDAGAEQLFDLLVFKPWVVLEFGGTEHCVRTGTGSEDSDPESVAVRPLAASPGADADLARRLRAGEELSAEGKVCVNNARKYAHRFLRHGVWTEERKAEYEALNSGDASGLPGGGEGYRLGVADKPATDAMEEGGQYQRLLVAIVVSVGGLGAVALVGALSVGVILAQILLLVVLAFAPVALVAAAIPGRGHTFFRGWLEKLAGLLLRKVAYSLILAVLLAVCGALAAATSQLGWLMSFGLQGLFFWAVLLQRRALTESLIGIATGPGAPGREGTLRMLGLYYGARNLTRPLRGVRRMGRSMPKPNVGAAGAGVADGIRTAARRQRGADRPVPPVAEPTPRGPKSKPEAARTDAGDRGTTREGGPAEVRPSDGKPGSAKSAGSQGAGKTPSHGRDASRDDGGRRDGPKRPGSAPARPADMPPPARREDPKGDAGRADGDETPAERPARPQPKPSSRKGRSRASRRRRKRRKGHGR